MATNYVHKAAEKRAHQLSSIPTEWRLATIPSAESVPNALEYIRTSGLLSAEEIAITETSDVATLLASIASQQISALNVTKAFAKRAAFAHQLTTCCTEIFFEEAFAVAKNLDGILRTTGKTVGPLHGLPVSIKDSVHIKGKDSTLGESFYVEPRIRPYNKRSIDNSLGWVGLIGRPAAQDANTAATLRKLGAVLYVKTNIPQSLMV